MTLRRIPRGPSEGWVTVGLVMLLCLCLAWSLDDANLVPGPEGLTDFLPLAAILGVLFGLLGPKVGWGRWTTYLVGGIFAALIVPLLVGAALGASGWPDRLFLRTADAAVGAFTDLIVEGRSTTSQTGHHLWILGLIVWASSMFASYAAFGHRRPINGAVLIGLLLLGNMALTLNDQLVYLVLFSLATLFLLIRFHTLDEQADWIRRRIGDPSAISGLYLRGGTVFIAIAVVGSLLLTRFAAADPLSGAWSDVSVRFVEWTRAIEKFLPDPPNGVAFAPTFGSTATIGNSWNTNPEPAFTIQIPPGEDIEKIPYLRAVTYDVLGVDSYSRSEEAVTKVDRNSREDLLAGTLDHVTRDGHREVTYRLEPLIGGSLLVAPGIPEAVDVDTTLTLQGDEGFFLQLDRRGGDGAYTVTSLLRGDDEKDPLTADEFRLRAAGKTFPAGIMERYGQKPAPGIMGPYANALLQQILTTTGPDPTEYDLAKAIESFLRDPANFNYTPDIVGSGVNCGELSRVECFAQFKFGFCRWYAATMAALMRESGYPVRIAEGFRRPAHAEGQPPNVALVRNSDAHAWVEVYFPRFGWVDFDPTGGGVATLAPVPTGHPVPSSSAGPIGSLGELLQPSGRGPLEGEDPTRVPGGGRLSPGPFIAIAILLAVIVAGVAFLTWRRGPRGPATADSAYGMVTRIASRLGFGPRPNQTVYEYAGALADVLPAARPELETVARAKVEVTYGGRVLGPDRLAGLKDAQRRLRVSLLRLLFRRDRRRRR
jgi:hypothetical protein